MAQDNGQLDPAETMAMVFMGMLILGSGAGAALAAAPAAAQRQVAVSPYLELGQFLIADLRGDAEGHVAGVSTHGFPHQGLTAVDPHGQQPIGGRDFLRRELIALTGKAPAGRIQCSAQRC